jgi:hypothetical protein
MEGRRRLGRREGQRREGCHRLVRCSERHTPDGAVAYTGKETLVGGKLRYGVMRYTKLTK